MSGVKSGAAAIACGVGLMFASDRAAAAADWPQWRGPNGDDVSAEVPQRLSEKKLLWRQPLSGACFGGIVAAGEFVVLTDHKEGADFVRCFRAADGTPVWSHTVASDGKLTDDYDPSPRATPLLADGRVFALTAFGELVCLEQASGRVVWRANLAKDFQAEVPQYGYSSSPVILDGKLIVNPGGKRAELAALDPQTGKVIWQTPGTGTRAAYATFIAGNFGGVLQIIGYDKISLGGWDAKTGKRLWSVTPDQEGDYNVGTPISIDGRLLVSTEHNGARLYAFGKDGVIVSKPECRNDDLALDMATPTLLRGLAFGTKGGLLALDTANKLKMLWSFETEDEFGGFANIIAGNDRLLVFSANGWLILAGVTRAKCEILGRAQLCEATKSHPALANGRLFIRDATALYCYSFQ